MKRVLKVKAVDGFGREYSYYKILNKYDKDQTLEEKQEACDDEDRDIPEEHLNNNLLIK